MVHGELKGARSRQKIGSCEVRPFGELTAPKGDSLKTQVLYGLAVDGDFLLMPDGSPLIHPDDRFLTHLGWELEALGEVNVRTLSLFSMFCTLQIFTLKEAPATLESLEGLLMNDPALQTASSGPEQCLQLERSECVSRLLARDGLHRPLFSPLWSDRATLEANGVYEIFSDIVNAVVPRYNDLTPPQRCVVNQSLHCHGSFLLGLALASSLCTRMEYAQAVLAVSGRDFQVSEGVSRTRYLKDFRALLADAAVFDLFLTLVGPKPGGDLIH